MFMPAKHAVQTLTLSMEPVYLALTTKSISMGTSNHIVKVVQVHVLHVRLMLLCASIAQLIRI
jgi:hypothetical protein